jgi:hypothetical protein
MFICVFKLFPDAESNKRLRQIREMVLTGFGVNFSQSNLFNLLLNTSQFEFRLRSMYKRLLTNRHDNFEKYRSEARSRMTKLANIYGSSGEGSGKKNDKLKDWFLARDEQMSHLNIEGKTISKINTNEETE